MINIVIIEDEIPARRKLKRFLNDVDETVSVVAELETVDEAVRFLSKAKNIHVVLSDIELRDGNAFEIYERVSVSCPIIFTTAYNQFLMDAFETNGIEYLLKPFSFERFKRAWDKFLLLRQTSSVDSQLVDKITRLLDQQHVERKVLKSRLAIPSNRGTYFLEVNDVLFFASEEGVVMAVDTQSKKHLLTYPTLKAIEELIDPNQFFRVNRSELVNKQYIERIERYAKNTIALKLRGYQQYLVTSQNSTAAFKEWVER